MDSVQDMYSTSEEVATSNTLHGLNDQVIEPSLHLNEVPVSDNVVYPSSSAEENPKLYACPTCNKSFMRKDNLNQHIMTHSGIKPFACNICQEVFSRKSSLKCHKLKHLKVPTHHKCDLCSEVFTRKSDLMKHNKFHSKPTIKHNCEQCSEVFTRKFDLSKHMKNHSKPKIVHNCEQCNEVFLRKTDLLKHRKLHKPLKKHNCVQCNEIFNSKSDLLHHVSSLHRVTTKCAEPSLKEALYEKVKHFKRLNDLNIFTKTTIESNEDNNKDFHTFFNSVRSDISNELNYQMEEKRRMKWYATMQVLVSRLTQEGDFDTATPYFHSKTVLQLNKNNLSDHIDAAFAKMISSFEKFTQLGSGWTLEKILNIELSTAKYSIM